MGSSASVETIDCLGELCPLPIIAAGRALRRTSVGSSFVIVSDDPGVLVDMPAFCHARRQELVSVETKGDVHRLFIRKVRA